MNLELNSKVVLVTGSNGGIGSSIVKSFLEEGAIVVALVRGSVEKLKELDDWFVASQVKGRLVGKVIDWNSIDKIEELMKEVFDEFGSIDVLVNNAGNVIEKPFLLLEEEEWDSIYDVHIKHATRLTKAVLKYMLQTKSGSIVNVTSVTGFHQGRGVSAYGSAKAALSRFTQILAQEVGKKKIRVNAVAPGAIETKLSNDLRARVGNYIKERTPLNRFGKSEEVADSVVFLASNRASYITGEVLVIDGGFSL